MLTLLDCTIKPHTQSVVMNVNTDTFESVDQTGHCHRPLKGLLLQCLGCDVVCGMFKHTHTHTCPTNSEIEKYNFFYTRLHHTFLSASIIYQKTAITQRTVDWYNTVMRSMNTVCR